MASRETYDRITRWLGILAVATMAAAVVMWAAHSLWRMLE
jgi:hypothetical protein